MILSRQFLIKHLIALTLPFFGGLHAESKAIASQQSPLLSGIIVYGNKDLLEVEEKMGVAFLDVNVPGNVNSLSCSLSSRFLNKPLNMESVEEIRHTLTNYFQKQGKQLILVHVPEQDITNGVLKVKVVESKLGVVRVENAKWTSPDRLKNYVRLKQGEVIDEKQLVDNLNFINRNTFRNVDIIYSPGELLGTTDVTLSVNDRRPFRLYAGVDNTGIETLGKTRWFAGVNWGNVFNLDHIFTYQYTMGSQLKRFQAHNFQYIAPLSWQHLLTFYGGYAHTQAEMDAPHMKHDGYAYQLSSRYTIPLKLSRYLRQDVVIGADFKRLNTTEDFYIDSVVGKNVNVTQLVLGYVNHYTRKTYRFDFNGDVFWSPGKWVADQTEDDYRSLRPGAKNHWVYGRGYLSFIKKLSGSFMVDLKLRGQLASTNLIATEQLGLGGYDTIRGYEEREANTDNGLIANFEFRASPNHSFFGKLPGALQGVFFVDYGFGKNHTALGNIDHVWLLGVGPGVRYTIEPNLTARLDWGIKLHHSQEFTDQKNFIYFSIIGSY